MLNPWNTLSKIGLTDDLTLSQKNQIVLLNRIVTIFSIAILYKLVSDIFDQDWIGLTLNFLIGTLFSITYLLHHFKKHHIARGYFITIFLVGITTINVLIGKGLGAEFSYFSIIVMTFIFFEKSNSKFFYTSFTILCYILSQIFFQNYDSPLEHILNESSYHFMFTANLICTLLTMLTFVKENKKFSQQTVKLLQDAEIHNKELETIQSTLEKQNKKLAGANKELEKFAYIASHDLKTPLRNINNFLNLINRKLKSSKDEELLEYIHFTSQNARQMHFLIEDILEYSRLNGDKLSLTEVNLN